MITNVNPAEIDFTAAERDAIYRDDFLAFAYAAFALLFPTEPLSLEWFHQAIAFVLTQSLGRRSRQIINAPPRSLKSFLVSIASTAYVLGRQPSHKFLCVSYSQDLASSLSSECRRLVQTDWYCNLFPTRLIKSTEDELVTTAGGRRLARSVGRTLTGLGGDTLIIDDPLNAKDVMSDIIRNEASDWFRRTLMSRLNDKAAGTVIVVMQRLHQDDLTGHLLEKGGWNQLVLPAIAPRDMLVPIEGRAYYWEGGEPLQKREGHSVLDDLKQQVGAQIFNSQYLQDPLPDTGNMLDPNWLKWCDCSPIPQSGDQIVQSWDTAMKNGPTNDYSVGITFLVRNNNQYYVLDILRKRMNFTELCDAVADQARKHKPNAILVEEHAAGTPLIDECKRRGMSNINGWRPTKDKRTRMDGETPKLKAGCLILEKSAPYVDDFRVEYLAFPNGKHDDIMDALSQFLNWRTTEESRTFSADFGHDDHGLRVGAPSADDMLRFGAGARLSPPFWY
ncbi:MAG: phage terminase large subunit [Xanthobacteraceae bacterium]